MIFRLHKILQNFTYFDHHFALYLETCELLSLPLEESRPWCPSLHLPLWAPLVISAGRFPEAESPSQTIFTSRLLESTPPSLQWSVLKGWMVRTASGSVPISPSSVQVSPNFTQEPFLKMTFGACHHPSLVRDKLRGIIVPLCFTSTCPSPPPDPTENVIKKKNVSIWFP